MRSENIIVIRTLMKADGVSDKTIDLALSIVNNSEWISSRHIMANLNLSRWYVWNFCNKYNIPVQVRPGRGGNLINAVEFYSKYQEVKGVTV